MRVLGSLSGAFTLAWWVLWELRPPTETPQTLRYDVPAMVLMRQTSGIVALVAFLLVVVFWLERSLRERVDHPFRGPMFIVQVITAACAGATGAYAVRILLWMRRTIETWPSSPELTATVYPVVAAAIVPWAFVLATLAIAVTARERSPALNVVVLCFDALVIGVSYLLFSSVYSWACLSCSGPAL